MLAMNRYLSRHGVAYEGGREVCQLGNDVMPATERFGKVNVCSHHTAFTTVHDPRNIKTRDLSGSPGRCSRRMI